MNYYIVIADIHGDIVKLNKALSDCDVWIKLKIDDETIKEKDKIQFLFLGDLIDRQPYSKEVIAKVKEYVEKGAILLIGNHDLFLTGTAEGTSVYFSDAGRSASNIDLWDANGGLKTCVQTFGEPPAEVRLDSYYAAKQLDISMYVDIIKNSDEYKFLSEHGKRKYETDLIFFCHAQQSDPKQYDDDILVWGRQRDYGKPDSSFKVPGDKLMSVHGHFHRLSEGITFPRITNYKHGGKTKTVVMADSGCGCYDRDNGLHGELHPVIITENPKKINSLGKDEVQIIAIL